MRGIREGKRLRDGIVLKSIELLKSAVAEKVHPWFEYIF